VYGYTAQFVIKILALAGMQASPNLYPERLNTLSDGERAANGPRRTIEGGKKTIAGSIDLSPPEMY
jgi:hypothetical protein